MAREKSDPIDVHLAVLTALRLDAARLPTPRADGDREALRTSNRSTRRIGLLIARLTIAICLVLGALATCTPSPSTPVSAGDGSDLQAVSWCGDAPSSAIAREVDTLIS